MTGRLSSRFIRSYRNLLIVVHPSQKSTPLPYKSLLSYVECRLSCPSTLTKIRKWKDDFSTGCGLVGSYVLKQVSPIFAQRILRSYRVLQLHCRLWSHSIGRMVLTESGGSFGGGANSSGRPVSNKVLLSFLIFSLCHPNSQKQITDYIKKEELVEHMKDLDFIHDLTNATVVCEGCRNRLVVDKQVPNVKYCHCSHTTTAYDRKVPGEFLSFAWTPFVETADLLIWRMPHPDRPGLYMYKVFGYYNDISPEDFLNTQLDIDYRRKWDDTVLKLEIVESSKEDNLDVIYWEMKWPTMFSNRDYLFARRYLVDKEQRSMVIMSKAVPHSSAPERKGIHRVKEYWSVMQVKAVKGLSDPGVEFGLTYFDNPGVSLPVWMSNWAAMTAIPDFLDKQRNASRVKKKGRKSIRIDKKSNPLDLPPSSNEAALNIGSHSEKADSEPSSSKKSKDATKASSNDQDSGTDSTTTSSNPTQPENEILSHFIRDHVLHHPQ